MTDDEERWTDTDDAISRLFGLDDPALTGALAAGREAGLPQIQVSPPYGKLLHLLALSVGARRILEIGTLAGYSGIWLARALPADGRLVTCEVDPRHAEVAERTFARAGLADRIEVRIGPARETLAALKAEGTAPFDMVFIDADKASYPEYLEAALALSRSGTLIVADNVVRRMSGDATDANVAGIRRFNAMLAGDPRLWATVIQTVGAKGYDGFALALVR